MPTADIREVSDAAAGIGTTYSMLVGQRFEGALATASDTDWIGIDLVAGQSYNFTAFGTGGATAGIDDTILRLMNSSGAQVAINDDINSAAGNNFSGLTFTAAASGRYFLNVSAFGGETGKYVVQAATRVFTLDQVVTQLTEVAWGSPIAIHHDSRTGGTITVNLSGLTFGGQQLALAAMEAWKYATGMEFVTSSSTAADIVMDDTRAGAFGGPASYFLDTGVIVQSTVNIGTDWIATYGSQLNTHTFSTFIHEIGHALGLGHPGAYDGAANYATDAYFLNDSRQMSIMSYFNGIDNTLIDATAWVPLTPMIADIAAMQALYGTPTAIQAGDTVWGVASNVGGFLGRIFSYAFDGVTADPAYWTTGAQAVGIGFTIYDTGGTDMFDVSNSRAAQVIDLRSEGISSVLGETGNVVIMRGSVIENARTGAGNDRITGNDAANRLESGQGNDTVSGGAGNDTVDGGAGNDSIDGGAGIDAVMLGVTRASATVTAISGGFQVVSAAGTDIYTNVESFAFSDRTVAAADLIPAGPPRIVGTIGIDTLTGGDSAELFYADSGSDVVLAGLGNDSVYGGIGDDVINGDLGSDVLNGEDGNDVISASSGDDTVLGGIGNDSVGGGDGNDNLAGGVGLDTIGSGNGNDIVHGDADNDVLNGGYGLDSLYGDDGNDAVAGSFDSDQLFGGDGNDTLDGGSGLDTLYGGGGDDSVDAGSENDVIYGGGGNDQFFGGAGDDIINGGAGNDQFTGGTGNDEFWGGTGADTFIFPTRLIPNGGIDTIRDFQNGFDVMRILGAGANYAALNIHADAGNVVVTFGQQTIVLSGISLAAIDQSDFIFA